MRTRPIPKSPVMNLWTKTDDLKMMFICMWGWEKCRYTRDQLANVLGRSEDAIAMRIRLFSGFYGKEVLQPETQQMWDCWEKYKDTPLTTFRRIAFSDIE